MSKIGLSLSMIGGILFFILSSLFWQYYFSMWKLGVELQLAFLFFLIVNGGAILGALLGFIGKSWQKLELVKIGCILCLLVGTSYPLWLLYNFLANPSTFFIGFFESLIETFYISLPELILFFGGITGFIECEWNLEKIINHK